MFKVIEKGARGYICLDCDNYSVFHGKFDIYRLYKPSRGHYDFDNEIICPNEMICYECRSDKIGLEISPNKVIKEHYLTAKYGLWLVGEKWLLDIDDTLQNKLTKKNLIKIIIESESESKSEEFYNQLADIEFNIWDWNEKLFSEYKFSLSLVKILSIGLIRQDEYGLVDEESSYENAKYIGLR